MDTSGFAVGVDIGGTRIRAGLVSHEGRVTGKTSSLPTGGNESAEKIINRILECISGVLSGNSSKRDIAGIGMGVTGPLDIKNGLILECPQLPTLHYYPLRKKIEDVFRMPVSMNNDANALILGESLWGAGKGFQGVLGFTLRTGLGCAFVWKGRLHLGKRELSGEIWPSPYREGTIEDYVSGAGISAMYRKISGQVKSALEIGELGDHGDADALAVWHEFGEAFGFAVSWAVNLIDPDIVIAGGSVANSFHLFEKSLGGYLKKYVCPSPSGPQSVVKAGLGDHAGIIGGAALLFRMHERI